ncbi:MULTISPECIES: hypothetical protein [unclassified Cyanobium]|uniref:hypothetical protein n=1 Tax=unclassified Cyanobium TaxID=2627006 RepID=UPI0020CC13DC|nr:MULTISPECIES: hypothetical protein [unclassified Cyanobium]MCP9860949.1 hypothetical protein [Cyanobium sp. Cruz-8H5]MCP9868222.1 hypothetical protein [Cyanobium sp. Cruz-8D1]
MSPTTAAGPPAAGRPAAVPEPVHREGTADPAALLQGQRAAECELAEALARFQSEVTPAVEMSLPAVVEAARGAFRLGFAYTSCLGLDDDGQPLLEVTVLHRGGDQLSSQVRLSAEEAEQEFTQAARLLAQLLGIPVLSATKQPQPSKAEALKRGDSAHAGPAVTAVTPVTPVTVPPSQEPESAMASVPTPTTASRPAEATQSPEPTPAPAAPADTIGPGTPDAPGTEESLRPLGEEERETLLEMVRSLRPVEARRQFQIAFRHHFNVPKEARSIAGFITQQRHKDFVDRFERELADLPPAPPEATPAPAGDGA